MLLSMIFYIDTKKRGVWTINPFFRLVIFIVFAVTTASMLLSLGEEKAPHTIQCFIILFVLVSLLHRDCYIFDVKTKQAVHKIGFAFFVKKRTWNFEEIGGVYFSRLYRRKALFEVQCSLRTKDGNILCDIEHAKKGDEKALEQRAKQAAACIGCPVEYINL